MKLKNSSLTNEDYYLNENGYIVFTEKYHLKRGSCCESGCKHCPYGFKDRNNKEKTLLDDTKKSESFKK